MKKVRETNKEMGSGLVSDRSSLNDMTNTSQIDLTPLAKNMLRSSKGSKEACLVVLHGPDVGNVIPLNTGEVIIGRSADCTAVMQGEGISRTHARVRLGESGRVTVQDLGSTNGTFIGGRKIDRETLEIGDKLLLGQNTILKFMVQDQIEQLFHEQMYNSSNRDGLTGIHNRKYLNERIVSELSFARRHRVALTFLMFDLDHFKKVNDTHGHQSGDQVLIAVTNAVADTVREEDVFGRYGGEEFAIIAQRIDFEGGKTLGERVRHSVANERVPVKDGSGATLKVTASVGVATAHPEAVVDSSAIISMADSNLFKAKESGRNRVVASQVF
ncbi:MAG: GGDEF domain-containing protein [Deltaproteobacteria bacterium]|nr:GGDEF domain-containing protein [Deltaproteobacteria bacterium]